jgi:hypothetical protein
VEPIVIEHRLLSRLLTLFPAGLIGIAVRVAVVVRPSLPVRLAVAAVVAVCAWLAYRLLTARVVADDDGIRVRGVWYEADLSWQHIGAADVVPAHSVLQWLAWGIVAPFALRLHTTDRSLTPVGALCRADDEDVARLLTTVRLRTGGWRPPSRRLSPTHESSPTLT